MQTMASVATILTARQADTLQPRVPKNAQMTNRSTLWRLILIGLSIVLGIQALRVFLTTAVYNFGEKYAPTRAAIPALIVFLTPFVVPLLVRIAGPRRALFITIGGLAV